MDNGITYMPDLDRTVPRVGWLFRRPDMRQFVQIFVKTFYKFTIKFAIQALSGLKLPSLIPLLPPIDNPLLLLECNITGMLGVDSSVRLHLKFKVNQSREKNQHFQSLNLFCFLYSSIYIRYSKLSEQNNK